MQDNKDVKLISCSENRECDMEVTDVAKVDLTKFVITYVRPKDAELIMNNSLNSLTVLSFSFPKHWIEVRAIILIL